MFDPCTYELCMPLAQRGRAHNRCQHWGKALSELTPSCFIAKKKKKVVCGLHPIQKVHAIYAKKNFFIYFHTQFMPKTKVRSLCQNKKCPFRFCWDFGSSNVHVVTQDLQLNASPVQCVCLLLHNCFMCLGLFDIIWGSLSANLVPKGYFSEKHNSVVLLWQCVAIWESLSCACCSFMCMLRVFYCSHLGIWHFEL